MPFQQAPRDGDAAGVGSSQKNVVDSTRMWDTVNDIRTQRDSVKLIIFHNIARRGSL